MTSLSVPAGPIDTHVHFLSQEFFDLAREVGPRLGIRCLAEKGRDWLETASGQRYQALPALRSPAALMEELKQMGSSAAVLSPPPFIFNYDLPADSARLLADAVNRGLGRTAAQKPADLRSLGFLPMQHPDLAVSILEQGKGLYGLRGFAIGSNISGKDLDHPDFQPIFARAEELGAVIFIHPWAPLGGERLSRHGLKSALGLPLEVAAAGCCLILGGVMDRFPRLPFFLAHGGGALSFLLGRLQRLITARGITLAWEPRDYLRSLYYDSIVLSGPALQLLVSVAGARQVLLGSDAPYHNGETGDPDPLGSLTGLTSPAAGEINLITHRNAWGLFFS